MSVLEFNSEGRTGLIPVPIPEQSDVAAWLQQEMTARKLPYLLAHLDDGVVWGRLSPTQDAVLTSHTVAPEILPSLLADTLIMARCFGPQGELLLWREDTGFAARYVSEQAADAGTGEEMIFTESYDTLLLLWGTHQERSQDGFTLWREGAQGLRHAVPFATGKGKPPRLRVRHYLAPEPMARVVLSRLVGFEEEGLLTAQFPVAAPQTPVIQEQTAAPHQTLASDKIVALDTTREGEPQ